MLEMWSKTRIYATVWIVSNLFSRVGKRGFASRCEKVKLVICVHDFFSFVTPSNHFIYSMMTDPIADMLTRIRNAQLIKKTTVDIPYSKFKQTIADILYREGYIASVFSPEGIPKMLRVTLKYSQGVPAIQSLVRGSTPGHRTYRKADELPHVLNDFGMAIVSTSKGLMTNKEARLAGVGGEVVCLVY